MPVFVGPWLMFWVTSTPFILQPVVTPMCFLLQAGTNTVGNTISFVASALFTMKTEKPSNYISLVSVSWSQAHSVYFRTQNQGNFKPWSLFWWTKKPNVHGITEGKVEKVHTLSITPDTVLFLKHNIPSCLFTCLFLPVSKKGVLVQRKHSSNHWTAREVPDTVLMTMVPLNFRRYLKHEKYLL